jgi:membrane-associated phospholipid phosphatase
MTGEVTMASVPQTRRSGAGDMRVVWSLVAASVAITAATVACSGLKFAHAAPFFAQFGGIAVCLFVINAYQRLRLPDNERTIFLLDMVLVYFIMAVAMMIFQYSLATFPARPISPLIQRLDHAAGFDWLSYATFVGSMPPLSATLQFCYSNWMREFVVALAAMAYLRKYEAMYEFTIAYVIAGMSTLGLTAALDVKSYEAVATYAIAGFHHPVGVSPEYLAKVTALRAGLDRTLDFDRIIGLVSFPSFHAGSALLLAVATRNLRWLWLPFLVFNALIILGTITAGGHNLMDVLGGLAFAIAGLAAAGAVRRAAAATADTGAAAATSPAPA